MPTHNRLATVTLLAVVLVLFAMAWLGMRGSSRRAALGELDALGGEAQQPSSDDPQAQREAPDERTNATPAAQGAELSLTRLRVRVLDEQDHPLSDVQAAVARSAADDLATFALIGDAPVLARASSDANGELAFELPPGIEHDVLVPAERDERYGQVRLSNCTAGQTWVVHLLASAEVFGWVTRRGDGTPVVGARVRVRPANAASAPSATETTATDLAGRYRIGGLNAERWMIELVCDDSSSESWMPLELAAGQKVRRDFALDAGATVAGRVLDAATSRPIEGASVGERWNLRKSVRTDAAGRFELRGFGSADDPNVYVVADGYGRTRHAVDLAALAAAGAELVIALQRGATARGTIVDVDDQPIARARITWRGTDDTAEGQLDLACCESALDGRFVQTGLRRETPHALLVQADGCASVAWTLGPIPPGVDELELGKIVLTRAALIAGRVLGDDGQPAGEASVRLTAADGSEDDANVRSTRCDVLGVFVFGRLAAGDYELRASRASSSATVKQTVSIESGEQRTDVELRFAGARGVIAGRVVDPEGAPIGDVTLDLGSLTGSSPSVRAKSASDGTFAFRELADDDYQLFAHARRSRIRKDLAVGEFALGHLRPDLTNLVVALPRAAPIAGKALDAQDSPLALAMILAYDARGEHVGGTVSNSDGSFELFVPIDAVVDLQLVPHERGGVVQLAAGANRPKFAASGVKAGAQNLVLRP